MGGGCGLEHGRWIKPGDAIELEVERLGVLKNSVTESNDGGPKGAQTEHVPVQDVPPPSFS